MNRSGASPARTARRVMAYCHDSVGLGHFHRTLAICERVRRSDPQITFLLATGTPYVPIFHLPDGVDYVKLPALAKQEGGGYDSKYLITSVERVLRCRKAMLHSAAEAFDPHVILVDKAPAGVCGELLPTLQWLRRHRPGTRIIFGMRDIEDTPASTISQWRANGAFEALENCYDEVWVYGMRDVFDVVTEYHLPPAIQRKLRYVGYVVQDYCDHAAAQSTAHRHVLVTVGGGTDGERLLRHYLDEPARLTSSRGVYSTIIGGPDLPRPVSMALSTAASRFDGVRWLDHVSCLACLIRQSDVVVSMGGYNTMCEIVSRSKPAVIVPRTSPRVEQAIRAQLWAQRADLDVIRPEALTPHHLARRVLDRLERGSPTSPPKLDFDGLSRICQRFTELGNGEAPHAPAVHL